LHGKCSKYRLFRLAGTLYASFPAADLGRHLQQLKRSGDWQLTEEAQRSALAKLVSAIADLDTSSRWGEGWTAASDGQRFSLPRRVLQQTYSTRFSDFALSVNCSTAVRCKASDRPTGVNWKKWLALGSGRRVGRSP